MSDRSFQNGFEAYESNLSNLAHAKRNTGRHSVDEYIDAEQLVE